jgi:hypothetical protein
MRFVHLIVIAALVFAAAHVYHIKMDSTVRTERVAKLRADIRVEREAISALRAEWAKLEAPLRVQTLSERHLKLAPLLGTQYDNLKSLPERPVSAMPDDVDPIASMIESIDRDIEVDAPEARP